MKAHQKDVPQSNSNKEISIDNFKFVLNKKQTIANNFFFRKYILKKVTEREREEKEYFICWLNF